MYRKAILRIFPVYGMRRNRNKIGSAFNMLKKFALGLYIVTSLLVKHVENI